LPFVAAPGGEVGIAADDKTFARIFIRSDLGHIALVEQGELERSAFGGELAYGGRAQGGDPAERHRRADGILVQIFHPRMLGLSGTRRRNEEET
jgi:hypothetical protein